MVKQEGVEAEARVGLPPLAASAVEQVGSLAARLAAMEEAPVEESPLEAPLEVHRREVWLEEATVEVQLREGRLEEAPEEVRRVELLDAALLAPRSRSASAQPACPATRGLPSWLPAEQTGRYPCLPASPRSLADLRIHR